VTKEERGTRQVRGR